MRADFFFRFEASCVSALLERVGVNIAATFEILLSGFSKKIFGYLLIEKIAKSIFYILKSLVRNLIFHVSYIELTRTLLRPN